MSYKLVDENSIISIADAIRLKGGTSASLVFPGGFVSAIGDISGGGGYTADDIAMRNISGEISGSATTIVSYAFYRCTSLISVNFSQATSIGSSAFCYCYSLTSVSLPQVTTIGSYAFYNCGYLTSVSLPQVTTIGSYAFYNCGYLASVNLSLVTTIRSYAFAYCSSLASINLPQATSIGGSTFEQCYSLSLISLPQISYIGGYAFRSCYNLLSLYLLGSSIPTLNNGVVFESTPISNYTTSTGGVYGSIYVPASLYNSYIAASYWTMVSAHIVSLTDSEIAALGR